ncbi:glutaredoxin family protein [Flagellimonas algicola]|nr:glutaredoxin domain-containing protein [Allomuricauda algicola]
MSLLSLQLLHSQNEEIELITQQSDSSLTFIAKNSSDVTNQFTLDIIVKNLIGYQGPITKLIPANGSEQIIVLAIPEGPWSYETNYTYKAAPTKEELIRQKKRIKQEFLNSLNANESTLVVFYGEGCPRSIYAKEMLERKKIPFTYLDASSNEYYSKVMFELIRQKEPNVERVQYPVIMVDDQLEYDIENLRWYLKQLIATRK